MEIEGHRILEAISLSPTARVFRAQSPEGEAVVVKMPATDNPSPRVLARYQRAYDLGILADTRAVVRHLRLLRHRSSVALVTEDSGSVSLASLIPSTGLPVYQFSRLGHALATAVARLHGSGILHRDINPHNVVVNPKSLEVRLIDLGLSTRMTRGDGAGRAPSEFEGTLAYMSPECCGRIDSPIDDRADLYSLGITLFEMAAGRLPFEHEDASALAHAHVARPPPDLVELRPEVPRVIGEIVATLLAKNPNERYASARGLANDLEGCVSEFQRAGRIDSFPRRQSDVSGVFRISDRLYGRELDRGRLRDAITALNRGARVFVSVSGVSGIGKTALVHEVQKQVIREGGNFCSGKFDQFRLDAPYLGVLMAFRALLRRVLASSEDALEDFRSKLKRAVGVYGRLVTEGIPELAALLGPQPEIEQVSPPDATRRFHLLVARLIDALASAERPLVMFLDDVQWADTPSLHLLEALADHPNTAHLLIVLGFRSNEVGHGHPLRETVATLSLAADVTETFELEPVREHDVIQLVADTLSVRVEESRSLASRVHAVAAGNPFFVREYLLALWERGFFTWDEARSSWSWSDDELPQHQIPDNVAELLTLRLRDLKDDCLDFLDTASCVGNEFDLQTLSWVHQLNLNRVAIGLAPAVLGGLIVPLDGDHEVYESLATWDIEPGGQGVLGSARYRFRHDKVRQTVHDRLDEALRSARHLRIGRFLLRHLSEEALAHRVVETFNHIVVGLEHLDESDEREQLAQLGLRAGLSARRALAFETAEKMLLAARSLLPPDPWTGSYRTTMDIHLALAECVHAQQRYDHADEIALTIIEHAADVGDASEAHGFRIRMHTARARYVEAVDIAVDVARSLGVKLPRKPTTAHILRDAMLAMWAQGSADPMKYASLPNCTDPKIAVGVSLLAQAAASAYFSEPKLLPLIGMNATRLCLKYGTTPHTPYAFAVWALVQCGALGRIENGVRFGELALELGRRYGGVAEARARFVVNSFVLHWRDPLQDCANALYTSWAQNRDAGDEENATYAGGIAQQAHFLAGGSLDIHERYGDAIEYVRDSQQHHVRGSLLAWVELMDALRQTELPVELAGTWYHHAEGLVASKALENSVQIAVTSIAAGILDHLAGRHESAAKRFALSTSLEEYLVSQMVVPGLAFFQALNAHALLRQDPSRRDLARVARKQLNRLRKWSVSGATNLAHRVALLEGYQHLGRGRHGEAVLAFHRCIDLASNESVLYQALADQGLAATFDDLGDATGADTARASASARFEAWGSPGLARLVRPKSLRSSIVPTSTRSAAGIAGEHLELRSLLTSIAAISSEIDETALLDRLMLTVMEAAGADRGLLLLPDDEDRVLVEVEAELGHKTQRPQLEIGDFPALARPVVDLARRSQTPVVIEDARTDELVVGNSHVEGRGVRAILATSIVLQGRATGWLYLENRVASGAFSRDRVAVVEALGAQAGIALTNARLYGRVQSALKAQTVLTAANRRFVPYEFLEGLGRTSIVDVKLSEAREREMNVLFVDLRGFSELSMRLGPSSTVQLINRYLSHVQPGIAAHGGFVGQYYGDGVLALFPNESDASLLGAVAMCRGLDEYNRKRDQFPELRFGMGLHSGPLTLGTIGDQNHFQCSVVGDSVNLASRLEGLTKHFGSILTLSAATVTRLNNPESFSLRSLGKVQVQGRSNALEVYDCLNCYPDELRGRLEQTRGRFEDARAAWTAGQFSEAKAGFTHCLDACADDQVSRRFLERLAEMRTPDTWDGIERPGKGKD